uniref:Putative secreted peptide n=1 Tax=Anopheles braziliensis TaxID=58242 RepID=A0A2M3ZXF5_9DIPT
MSSKIYAACSVIMFLGIIAWKKRALRIVYCTRYSSEEDLDRRSPKRERTVTAAYGYILTDLRAHAGLSATPFASKSTRIQR